MHASINFQKLIHITFEILNYQDNEHYFWYLYKIIFVVIIFPWPESEKYNLTNQIADLNHVTMATVTFCGCVNNY